MTVVDAGVVIGLLDERDAHHVSARVALGDGVQRGDRLVLPASALAEVLVGPSRRGRDAVSVVLGLVELVPLHVAVLDQSIAVAAAMLRATHRTLKLPDALIIATASETRAARILTTDRQWPTARQLGLTATIQVV